MVLGETSKVVEILYNRQQSYSHTKIGGQECLGTNWGYGGDLGCIKANMHVFGYFYGESDFSKS